MKREIRSSDQQEAEAALIAAGVQSDLPAAIHGPAHRYSVLDPAQIIKADHRAEAGQAREIEINI